MSEPDVFTAAAQVVDSAQAAVIDIAGIEFWKVQDRDLLTLARQVEHLARLVHTAQVHLAGEIDTRDIAAAHGAASAASLLRTTLGVSHGDARSMVTTAAMVLPRDVPSGGELPPALPLLARALADGELGLAQARTVVTTMGKLPAEVDQQTRDLVQQHLVEQGKVTEPTPFAVFARAILVTLDQNGKDFDEDPPADHMEFSFGTRNPNTGLTRITGQVDDLSVEVINQAINTLSKPHPGKEGTAGSKAGANTDTAGSKAGANTGTNKNANTGGTETDGNADTGGTDTGSASRSHAGGRGSAVDQSAGGGGGAVDQSAGGGGSARSNGVGGMDGVFGGGSGTDTGKGGRRGGKWAADPRPAATRRAQALIEALRRFLDLGDAPLHGGERPHVTVTMTLQDLLGALPTNVSNGPSCTCRAGGSRAVNGRASTGPRLGRPRNQPKQQ